MKTKPHTNTSAHKLNQIEQKILDGICRGLSNAQIARELCLAEKTVKNYNTNIFAYLGVSSRTEAIAKCSDTAP